MTACRLFFMTQSFEDIARYCTDAVGGFIAVEVIVPAKQLCLLGFLPPCNYSGCRKQRMHESILERANPGCFLRLLSPYSGIACGTCTCSAGNFAVCAFFLLRCYGWVQHASGL